ncbi:DUF418 domain-containing protein [Novosphingobium sp. ZN18A2]|uniref:DUF418 domain-containing protein n=1 Tax=Novosphingobium sp. ZN18A2 TaxID=3079861 RepID=UPI0030D62988
MRSSADPGQRVSAPEGRSGRIAAIDGLRGLAVLGILAINVTGFWGPAIAAYSPHLPAPDPQALPWFAIAFVVFEGKMRALFSLLFGASMVLFMQAAERRGADGDIMQARRLLWLAVFGYLHFLLLWWGDILFPYAVCGALALLARRLPVSGLVAAALLIMAGSSALDSAMQAPGLADEIAVMHGHGTGEALKAEAEMQARFDESAASDRRILKAGFAQAVTLRIETDPWLPVRTALFTLTETLPLMLLGMALYRSGFFTGGWSARALRMAAATGIGAGGGATLLCWWWLSANGFPPRGMFAAIDDWLTLPHLAMALGYASAFLLSWPWLAARAAGRALGAAGRCAFSNYIGTSALMGAIFSGWGLGLGESLPRVWLPAFVLLGWAAMLAWPQWWLARFGQGPLEGLWRRLTWWGAAR